MSKKQFDISEIFSQDYQNQILPQNQQEKNKTTTKAAKSQQTNQTELEKLIARCSNNKPFWIWDPDRHKLEYARTKGHCCFNHIIGLPRKDGEQKGLFDYEKTVYDALQSDKYIWVKKAAGLGITEFTLRYLAWLCVKESTEHRKIKQWRAVIVTGPRIDLTTTLIKRFKNLFAEFFTFEEKETVAVLNDVTIEAFPSHHLDTARGLTDVKFMFADEADFFGKKDQADVRDVMERYIGKSDAQIMMVSTPNKPGGLFERIELGLEESAMYKKIFLPWQVGLDRIYSHQDIDNAKRSPSFEREYNLKYLGSIGNVFNQEDIDAALATDYDIIQYEQYQYPYLQAVMGIDPGWGSSSFGIVVTHFVDGKVRVAYADQFSRSDHSEMVGTVWELIQKYNVTKVLVDSSAPSFIRALKLQWGERSDYENVERELRDYMKVEPVSFGVEHKALLYHVKFMLENQYLQIHPTKMDKLTTALRSAYAKDGTLDKEITSYDDILDALRLCLRPYKES